MDLPADDQLMHSISRALSPRSISCERSNWLARAWQCIASRVSEAMVVGSPRECISTTRTPRDATSAAMPSSAQADTSFTTLGTDGFGRSDTRTRLRRFFQIDVESTVIGTLYALAQKGEIERSVVAQAIKDLGVNPEMIVPQLV